MPGSFFDSNILLYTISPDPVKRASARALVEGGGVVSVQVLNEVANVARRKLRLYWADTRDVLQPFRSALQVIDVTEASHVRGLALAELYGFAVHDSMIAAAALGVACDTLWSEDMHDGLVVDARLTIRNPFV